MFRGAAGAHHRSFHAEAAAGLRIASRVQVAVRRRSPIPRVAFGITVIGILVGMLAFGVAIVRERIYAHDYSDLEYDAAALGSQEPAR